ncbi:MAG TPA: DNA-3-methyladenine glycosylase [Candidatus Humimicrobiaceae bacterium]
MYLIRATDSCNCKILERGFYSRDTAVVAKELIGKLLVKRDENLLLSGIITETEAYYGYDDPASHAFRGRTPRANIMFGRAGIAYIYFCYGMYHMLNAVTEREDVPGAVLIRAVLPVNGKDIMGSRRNTTDIKKLANGPGKLTTAFCISLGDNGKDLTDSGNSPGGLTINELGLMPDESSILQTPRIGISNAKEKYLRFVLKDPDRFKKLVMPEP